MFSEFWNDAHSICGTAGSSAGAWSQCGTSQNPYHVLCTKPSESYQGFGTPDMAQGVEGAVPFVLRLSGRRGSGKCRGDWVLDREVIQVLYLTPFPDDAVTMLD